LKISGYIPSFNNETTIADSIKSLKFQSYPIDQIFVIDDGSSDRTVSIAKMCGIDVYCNEKNMGRGFTRAKAMQLAKHDIVVCCDATNELDVNFVRDGITAFADHSVASVFGKISSKTTSGIVNQWRSTHLFKEKADYETGFVKSNLFITYGTTVRKSHILDVGNFNPDLKHSEDEEMGERLLQNGYTLLSNHDLKVNCNVENSLLEVLERYWRWYIGKNEKMSFMDYVHTIKGSLNPMVIEDIKSGSYKCIFISLLCPHYCFFKTLSTNKINQ
jgi:glycosyltransferase involved in cell wall biosynthesis